jgi:hypothetical protein
MNQLHRSSGLMRGGKLTVIGPRASQSVASRLLYTLNHSLSFSCPPWPPKISYRARSQYDHGRAGRLWDLKLGEIKLRRNLLASLNITRKAIARRKSRISRYIIDLVTSVRHSEERQFQVVTVHLTRELQIICWKWITWRLIGSVC